MIPKISLSGQSGQAYKFNCYAPQTGWHAVAGCYVFVTHAFAAHGASNVQVHYIGQTDSFQRRIREHQDEKWASAAREGANLVLALTVPNEAVRLEMEQDLIRAYQPRLNVQHAQQNVLAQAPLNRLAQGYQLPRNSLLDLLR